MEEGIQIQPYRPKHLETGTDLLFITTSLSNRATDKRRSSHAVRVHAAKAGKINKKQSVKSPSDVQTDKAAPQDFRVVKKEFTSRIKLQNWTRKSGRKKAIPDADQELSTENALFNHAILNEPTAVNPFPIKFLPGTNAILSFYMGRMRTNSVALNPDGDWFDFFCGHAVVLQAMLSNIGRIMCLSDGIPEDIDVFKHQAEAVRLINCGISKGRDMDIGVIMAVAVLVNQESMMNCLEAAEVHMQGLLRMVRLRGGLESITSKAVLQRIISWADFTFAASWGRPLLFPRVQKFADGLEPSTRLQSQISQNSLRNDQLAIIVSNRSLIDILDRMDAICNAIPKLAISDTSRTLVGNSIYNAEYRLFELDPDRLTHASCSNEGSTDISEPLAAAAHLFLHIIIRSVPVNATRHRRLFDLLSYLLNTTPLLNYAASSRLGLCFLVWMHTVGSIDGEDFIARGQHLMQLERLCAAVGIAQYEEFELCLKEVLWVDEFGIFARRAWEDVELSLRFTLFNEPSG
ncbi:hypothetical protein EJ04DRAFT_569440 [Polyplosphaeria fusca]|uniref:Tachykinin family protein n=1 Tax=Polyplosphaeria fusca TaxID=682080 RepID=A0A9P4QLH5_9PLEO|nr:hypothetical protein EJ04DRAFT_569440 [Polyplosphaeria fusca]